jgi:hypothetical protein
VIAIASMIPMNGAFFRTSATSPMTKAAGCIRRAELHGAPESEIWLVRHEQHDISGAAGTSR